MKNYVLNNSPVITTRNFNINSANVDLNFDDKYSKPFENIMIKGNEDNKIIISNGKSNNYNSLIGLTANINSNINIEIPKNTIIEKPIKFIFDFDEESSKLYNITKIEAKENSKAELIFVFMFKMEDCHKDNINEVACTNYYNQIIKAAENADLKVTISNLLTDNSDSFLSFENDLGENATLTHNFIDLGCKNKITNYHTIQKEFRSTNNINSLYLGKNKDLIDIIYNIEQYGKESNCNIKAEGAIKDRCVKNFRGIIDFKQGATNSTGLENENCLLLSDTTISRSLPVLLCHEEDVNGAHGVSNGKISETKLFYLMSKGISFEDAKRLIIKANFNRILNNVNDEDLVQKVEQIIDKI